MPKGVYKHHKGRKLSEETKEKMSKAKIGQERSIETRLKISKSMSGENCHRWKGGISKDRKNYQKEFNKKWTENNREYKNFLNLRREVRRKKAEGSHTFGEWELLKKQYGYKCPACKKLEPEIKLTEDHIVPLIKGGSDYIENIQPLCRSCNCKKHTKIIKYEINEN